MHLVAGDGHPGINQELNKAEPFGSMKSMSEYGCLISARIVAGCRNIRQMSSRYHNF